jgi:DNA-binding NarL/FixJ family response regulator
MPITILLAEDHKIVREGLHCLLEREPEFTVVAMADNGRTALELVGQHRPALAVMDLSMPEMNGIEATRRIVSDYPGTLVLALSMHSERRYVQESLDAGARGYLLKDCAFEELLAAIRAVLRGDIYLSPKIAGIVVEGYLRRTHASETHSFLLLSVREREVLQLIAGGKSTKEIAFFFKVSIKTVESQRQQIMKKLQIFSVAELTKFAVREGLTTLE